MEVSGHPTRLGKYELRGELGRGAMGVVYRAWDRSLEREVALKTMAAPDADPEQTERFLREAKTAGSLHHPNIVTVHELGTDSGTHFIAMELMEGTDLSQVLKSGKVLPLERRLEIVARVCDGLEYAHRAGIVHRDVKPANVFLAADGSVKILDFGVAKIATSDATRTGMAIGTVDYMSPEQVRAVKNLDGRSDLFSAGVILYELLFGKKPFSAGDLGATLHRILTASPPGEGKFDDLLPPGLGGVLRRSLEKDRGERYASGREMAAALDRVRRSLTKGTVAELDRRITEIHDSLETASAGPGTRDLPDGARGDAERGSVGAASEPPRGRSWIRTSLVAATAVAALAVAGMVATRWIREVGSETMTRGERSEAPRVASPDTEPQEIAIDRPAVAPSASPSTTGSEQGPAARESTSSTPEESTAPEPLQAPEARPTPAVETTSTAIERAATAPAPEPKPGPPVLPVAPAPTGSLDVLVMPWARIEWIENLATGERSTTEISSPARLELPAGKYRLHLVHPHAPAPLELDVIVREGRTGSIRRTMPGFDPGDLAREILAVEVAKGSTP